MLGDVSRRDLERVTADVARPDLHLGRVIRDGDRDIPAAGTNVRDTQRMLSLPRDLDRTLDQHLRVRVRHQHGRGHLEVQGHELFVSDEICDGHAASAASGQVAIVAELFIGQRPVELQVEIETAHAEYTCQQNLRVEARRTGSVLLQMSRGRLQDLDYRQFGEAFPPFSRAARSALTRAATSSSRSPFITWSSL